MTVEAGVGYLHSVIVDGVGDPLECYFQTKRCVKGDLGFIGLPDPPSERPYPNWYLSNNTMFGLNN